MLLYSATEVLSQEAVERFWIAAPKTIYSYSILTMEVLE